SSLHSDGWLGYEPIEKNGYGPRIVFLSERREEPSELLPRVRIRRGHYRLARDAELAHHGVKGRPRHVEPLRRCADDPFALFQNTDDMLSLDFLKRRAGHLGCRALRDLGQGGVESRPARKNDRSFYEVFQFPDVAGPRP